MFLSKKIQFLGFLLFFPTIYLSAQNQVVFDYTQNKATATIPYNKEVKIILSHVNTLDFEYKVEIEAISPRPASPDGTFPKPAPNSNPAIRAKQNECDQMAAANTALNERLVVFGDGLQKWLDEFKQKVSSEKVQKVVFEEIKAEDIKEHGRLNLVTEELVKKLTKTSAGGGLKITVVATPKLSKVIDEGNCSGGNPQFKITRKDVQSPSDEVKKHSEVRKYTLEFETPRGIDVSFGPYISFMGQKSFVAQKKPDSQEQVIGLDQDDDIRYGVAAYWTSFLNEKDFGLTWGVAYTTQGSLDEQIQGLLGCSWRPYKGRVNINFGLSVGSEKKLASGYELGTTTIDANQAIPVTSGLGVDGFIGLSFRFQ